MQRVEEEIAIKQEYLARLATERIALYDVNLVKVQRQVKPKELPDDTIKTCKLVLNSVFGPNTCAI